MGNESPSSRPDSALEAVFYHDERIRFIYWTEFSSARIGVVLTTLTAVLSFVTGLSVLSQDVVALDGPLAAALPDVTAFVRFGGILLAFTLGVLVLGLFRGKRVAWYLTMVTLPIVGTLPLLTLETTQIPLLFLVFATLVVLSLNRSQFDNRLDLSSLQIASLSSIVGVLLYGTVGSYVIRDQFLELDTWSDAFYYVLVTIATVGYGDITPLTTEAKWFSLSVIVLGTGAFTAAIGSLLIPAIEDRMASAVGNMTPQGINLLEDHVLVLGYSDITESLLEELEDEKDVVVITADQERASELDERDVNVLTADPSDEEALHDARIEAASGVVVATRDDAEDVLAILAAREANPGVYIIAAANEQQNASKFETVGADEVISPMAIGGRLLGRSVLGRASPESFLAESPETESSADETSESER